MFSTAERVAANQRGARGQLEPEAGQLMVYVAGQHFMIERDDVESAFLERTQQGQALVIRTKDQRVVSALVTDEQLPSVKRILSALGADSKALRLSISASSGPARGCASAVLATSLMVLFFALLMLLSHVATPRDLNRFVALLFSLGVTGMIVSGLTLRGHALLIAGSDGITVARGGNRRFIRHSEITSIHSNGRSLLIVHQGQNLELSCHDAEVAADAALQLEGCAPQQGDDGGAHATILDRGDRTLSEWQQHLATLQLQERGYRTAALVVEQLWRVVESSDAPPDRRVGAAHIRKLRP